MNKKDYKYILVNDIRIAYKESGSGKTILFVHGFASSSYTWNKLISLLPQSYRFISIDLKSFGYSEKVADEALSPFEQSTILKEFVKLLRLRGFILVGHSMGGAVSSLSLHDNEFRKRVSALILLDSAGLSEKLPEFIGELSSLSPENPLLRIIDSKALALHVLLEAYYDKNKITNEAIEQYSRNLKSENYRQCLIASAKQFGIPDIESFREKQQKLKIPSLIMWGENDKIINVKDSYLFRDDLKCNLFILSKCGHSPHEECPEKTAEIIRDFLDSLNNKEPLKLNDQENIHQIYNQYVPEKIKISRLIDKWTLGSVLMLLIIKTLQLMRKMGFKAKEDAWRKICGTFLRNEQSKFMLASFRLLYYEGCQKPATLNQAKSIIINKLSDFIKKTPSTHWALKWSLFKTHRDMVLFTDILEAEFSHKGKLRKLIPHFDSSRKSFSHLNDSVIKKVITRFIIYSNYHESAKKRDHIKGWFVFKSLYYYTKKFKVSPAGKQELKLLIRRLINSSLVTFEVIKETDLEKRIAKRLKTPNTRLSKHPGLGLLNIRCRIMEDLSECDMWVQYHHVPVDGLPMQEMMQTLKTEMGEKGRVIYPKFNSPILKPEIFYSGNSLFRARIFVQFEKVLKLRKYLNEKYINQMHGSATLSSLIIWGLSQREFFKNIKFLFPVDISNSDLTKERSLGILCIRPSNYFNDKNPLEGFLSFQRAFNRQIFLTRIGKSETHEFLELISLLHPSINWLFNKIFPKTIREVMGTVGITILKDSEMFVSPSTDIQRHGFIALGKVDNITQDGKLIGAVNICGKRKQIREYFIGLDILSKHLPEMLNIKLD